MRYTLRYYVAGALALLAFTPISGRAAADPVPVDYFELTPEQLLEAEVVSASRRAESLSEIPAAVFVITAEDIARAGVTTIPEALRMAPGVQVAQVDANSWAISIRGFNATLANKLLVMIDGRTIYNPLHSGVYWEAHNLMLENIERIEVVRGPGGALWGANAVNGVINIITKTARNTQGNLISLGYGNHERGFVNARHGGMISNDAYYRIYAKYFNRDSFRDSPGGDMDSPDEWDGYRSGFRVDWDATERDHLTVNGNVYRTDSGQFFQDFALTDPFVTIAEETARNTGVNIMGQWSHNLDSGALLSLQSFVDYTTREETLLADDRLILDIDGQYNFAPIGRHDIIAGAGYRYMVDNLEGSPLVDFNPGSRKDPLYTAFVQDRITLAPDRWHLTLGSKFEYNHYTGFEVQPNARLAWTPDERQTVWAAVSRAVRTPSRIERDLIITNLVIPPGGILGPLPAEVQLVNNKSFGTEKLTAYELGYRKQVTPDLFFDAAAFFNSYHDLQSLESLGIVNVAGPPAHIEIPLIFRNEMSGETYGIELVADWNVRSDWRLSATYTYLEMFLHAPKIVGTSQETEEGESPIHQASFRSLWDINEDWSLNSTLHYVDQLSEDDVPAYLRLDMNLGWQIREDVKFNLIGLNLFNNDRAEFNPGGVNTSEIGTSVFGKLTWEF